MATRALLIYFLIQFVHCKEESHHGGLKNGIIDHLNTGMKFAKDFLGSESVALKVAEFVVRAFQKPGVSAAIKNQPQNQNKEEEESLTSKPFEGNEASNPLNSLRHLVRLFGLQPTQISAVAVNALLFVAQMISTFLAGPQRPSPNRPNRSEDPLTWILKKPSQQLQDILANAKNESLPDVIEEIINNENTEDDISCVRLLICKLTPFVSKMQKAVFGMKENLNLNEKSSGAAIMYRHLPTQDEINTRNDVCELKYRDCDLESYD